MTDTSTPSPSDPGKREPGQKFTPPGERPKLKLKLQRPGESGEPKPSSPPPREALIPPEEEKPPHAPASLQRDKPRLTPAVPSVAEPPPPPPPSVARAGPPPPPKTVQIPKPPVPVPPSPAESSEPEITPDYPEMENADQPATIPWKSLFLILALFGAALAVHFVYDPLELRFEPKISTPIVQNSEDGLEETPNDRIIRRNLANFQQPPDGAHPEIQTYLRQLIRQRLTPSFDPRGVFVNSVFYEEGMSLNPLLGLKVFKVTVVGSEKTLEILDAEGRIYPILLP